MQSCHRGSHGHFRPLPRFSTAAPRTPFLSSSHARKESQAGSVMKASCQRLCSPLCVKNLTQGLQASHTPTPLTSTRNTSVGSSSFWESVGFLCGWPHFFWFGVQGWARSGRNMMNRRQRCRTETSWWPKKLGSVTITSGRRRNTCSSGRSGMAAEEERHGTERGKEGERGDRLLLLRVSLQLQLGVRDQGTFLSRMPARR